MLLRHMDVVSPLSPPIYVFCTLLLYILLLFYFQARIMPPKSSATRSRKRTAKVSVPTVPSKRPVGARSKANKNIARQHRPIMGLLMSILESCLQRSLRPFLREAGLVPPLASTARRTKPFHRMWSNAWGYVLSG